MVYHTIALDHLATIKLNLLRWKVAHCGKEIYLFPLRTHGVARTSG